jgi:hypothetical protein
MEKITSVTDLKKAIQLLEIKRANEAVLLKEEFKKTYETLRPSNLVKKTLAELVTAPGLKGDLLTTAISLAAGYLSKKTAVGSTHNPIKQLLGTVLQMGVTKIVSNNSDGIKSTLSNLINLIISKKEK